MSKGIPIKITIKTENWYKDQNYIKSLGFLMKEDVISLIDEINKLKRSQNVHPNRNE